MFGLLADFSQRTICIVPVYENARARWFAELLVGWRARTVVLSAEEHDRSVAIVQAACHACILTYAALVSHSAASIEKTFQLATHVQTALLALATRITSGDVGLYWSVQADNPYAGQAREDLISSLCAFHRAVGLGAREDLVSLFKTFSEQVKVELPDLIDLAARIIEVSKRK
jgi:prephenate dehydrogenase